MILRMMQSWILLARFDLLRVRGLSGMHEAVQGERLRTSSRCAGVPIEELCHAVDLACVFYVKKVLCLQRSAVATVLLRRYGWPAELIVGARFHPFKSHAWVEVESVVANDRPYMREVYQELTRC